MSNELVSLVEAAVKRLSAPGIIGWGMNNPDPELFDETEVGPASGCTSETCNHNSHDPATSTIKLTPKSGQLVALGGENYDDEGISYWALVDDPGVKFFEQHESRAYWERLRKVDSVPDWALAKLAEPA